MESNSIKRFVLASTEKYSFLDDVTAQNPFSSRFGVIEFSDSATVSVPLGKYSRNDFLWKMQNNTGYGSGGDSNVSSALSLAYDEIWQHGTPNDGNYRIPKVVVLVVNDISPFDLKQAMAAINKLKDLVQLPIGVIVPGLPGIIPGSQTRLANLTGNANYTFGSIDSAITGIPALTNSTFSCPVCSNVIFICEMTAAIGWETKKQCLQLSQRLAIAASHNSKRRYAIALYGTQIYHSIVMQDFLDFNDTINQMIKDAEESNIPNGGQTFLAPILNQLYTTLGNTTSSSKFVTLIIGELSYV
uniref:VWFA domain-containing protein n=1 Tax=Panagrolaimus sp. ES5 TaxID=591445 RepID=A0AC34FQS3_9BILA